MAVAVLGLVHNLGMVHSLASMVPAVEPLGREPATLGERRTRAGWWDMEPMVPEMGRYNYGLARALRLRMTVLRCIQPLEPLDLNKPQERRRMIELVPRMMEQLLEADNYSCILALRKVRRGKRIRWISLWRLVVYLVDTLEAHKKLNDSACPYGIK